MDIGWQLCATLLSAASGQLRHWCARPGLHAGREELHLCHQAGIHCTAGSQRVAQWVAAAAATPRKWCVQRLPLQLCCALALEQSGRALHVVEALLPVLCRTVPVGLCGGCHGQHAADGVARRQRRRDIPPTLVRGILQRLLDLARCCWLQGRLQAGNKGREGGVKPAGMGVSQWGQATRRRAFLTSQRL